ncbi:MAG: ATP-dependent Clp protease proteolytic subunit [Chloroflexi bacterium]|nr:ATP-dependent Clp protease proteolytic subunit [Chloroflexota bacterium]
MIPTVIESSARGERAFDIYSLLLRERIIFLGTDVNDQVANSIVAQLLYLDREDSEKDIHLYINSPGGSIRDGLAIIDTMNLIKSNVSTIVLGTAASMATVILSAGKKGKRYALPHSTVHMHQALGGAQGQASDIEITAKEILRLQDLLRRIMAENTGQSLEKIAHDSDRDFYMDARGAMEYGFVDEILGDKKEDGK